MGYSFQFIVVRESMWSRQEDGISCRMKNLCFVFLVGRHRCFWGNTQFVTLWMKMRGERNSTGRHFPGAAVRKLLPGDLIWGV